jgi:hypothetical protein
MSLRIDHRLASIIRGYLDTNASRSAGVPAIPVRRMDDGTAAVTPRLVVSADQDGDGSTRIVDVHVSLHGMLGSGTGQTTGDQASQWMQAVELRCKDRAALDTYVGTLTELERTGYQVLRLTFPAPPQIDRETEGEIIQRTTLRFICRV